MNNTIKINVSREAYQTKDETKVALVARGAGKMSWHQKDITIEEFCKYAMAGHTFAHLYNNANLLRISDKKKANFVGAQCVFVDIDETSYDTFEDFVDTLPIHPQVAYSSYSDMIEKSGIWSRRFHLVYFFDEIMDRDTYASVASYLYSMIEDNTNEPISDKCGLSPVQYMNGCYNGAYSIFSTSLLSISSLMDVNEGCNGLTSPHNISLMSKIDDAPIYTKVSTSCRDSIRDFSEEAIEEFMSVCHYRYFYDNSRDNEWIYTAVTLSDKTIRCAYQFVDVENYCSLYYNPTKVKDGDKRRKKLYERALMRRWFKPSVTPNELFYNYVMDVRYDFEVDSDLTVDNAIKNVNKVMELTMVELSERVEPLMKKGIENRGNKIGLIFRMPREISNSERQTIKGQIRKEIVRSLYDTEKNVEENNKILADNGIFLDNRTIYRYVSDLLDNDKETRNRKIKQLYNPNLSLDKNVEAMKQQGVKISRNTLKKIINEKAA